MRAKPSRRQERTPAAIVLYRVRDGEHQEASLTPTTHLLFGRDVIPAGQQWTVIAVGDTTVSRVSVLIEMSPSGLVTVSSRQEGARLVITVEDDEQIASLSNDEGIRLAPGRTYTATLAAGTGSLLELTLTAPHGPASRKPTQGAPTIVAWDVMNLVKNPLSWQFVAALSMTVVRHGSPDNHRRELGKALNKWAATDVSTATLQRLINAALNGLGVSPMPGELSVPALARGAKACGVLTRDQVEWLRRTTDDLD